MKKPANHTFEDFAERFEAASKRAGKEQYLVPYFIASHPGSEEAKRELQEVQALKQPLFLRRAALVHREVVSKMQEEDDSS